LLDIFDYYEKEEKNPEYAIAVYNDILDEAEIGAHLYL
jgi:hypothetical protein